MIFLHQITGTHYVVSEYAVKEVRPREAYTDDMREMVERLGVRIRREPCILQTPAGLVIHPVLERKLREQVQRHWEEQVSSVFGFLGNGKVT